MCLALVIKVDPYSNHKLSQKRNLRKIIEYFQKHQVNFDPASNPAELKMNQITKRRTITKHT